MCSLPTSILNNQTVAAYYCTHTTESCLAICANPDISGVGVRAAFYAQSIISASLVALSPRDSVPAAWAGTLLTTALIVAAIIQRSNQDLTLHHATLILNFATLSCISSLAVAPKLPLWHIGSDEDFAQHVLSHALGKPVYVNFFFGYAGSKSAREAQHGVKDPQVRARLILVISLLAQVVLQWAWGVIMFVSPLYSQQECNVGGRFAVWPLYIMFCLATTLALWIRLVLSCSERAHSDLLSRRTSIISVHNHQVEQRGPLLLMRVITTTWNWISSFRSTSTLFWADVFWFAVWLVYLIASELQIRSNCIFSGEDEIKSFGQVTAVLLISSSLWSVVVAIYRYPSVLRTRARHRSLLSSPASQNHVNVFHVD